MEVLLYLRRDVIRCVIQYCIRITLRNVPDHGCDVNVVINSYLLTFINEILFKIDRILLLLGITLTLTILRLLLLLNILFSIVGLLSFDLLLVH